jgi:5-methylcytosine-specific restriction protein B
LIGVEWIFDFVENYGAPIEKPGDITGFVQPTVRKYPHYEKLKEFLLDQFPDLSEGFERIETRRAQLSVNNIDTIPPGLDSQTGTENTKPDPTEELSISLEPEMIVGLHFPDTMATSLSDLLQQIEAALNAGNHVMFTGPPGTGKTELAEQVAEHLAAEHEDLFTGAHLTTATADWSTFETIGGYMPARNGEGELEFRAGQLLRRFKRNDHQRNDITVIDEINRADIDKAFGQLFTVLSGQKVYLPYEVEGGNEVMIRSAAGTDRSADIDESVAENGDETVDELPEEEFIIPESWRLMATMNSYDKTSLYDMSFAFMRRFTFIRVGAPKIPEPTDEDPSPEEFIAGYLDKWDNVNLDPNNMVLQGVLDAWRIMNRNEDARSLGPAIAMDMLGFVSGLSYTTKPERNRAVARAVTAYVFPQLEGMIDKQRDPVIEKLKESDHIDGELISEAAAEQFQ